MKKDKHIWPEIVDIKKGDSMTSSKYLIAGIVLLIIVVLVGTATAYANIDYAQEGTVKVVTYFGRIERVYTPADGWFTTLAPGRDSHEVTIRSFTESAPVRVTSKDNAALNVKYCVTLSDDAGKVESIRRKYSFNTEERHRGGRILKGLLQTEARNAFSEFNAYEIYAIRKGFKNAS